MNLTEFRTGSSLYLSTSSSGWYELTGLPQGYPAASLDVQFFSDSNGTPATPTAGFVWVEARSAHGPWLKPIALRYIPAVLCGAFGGAYERPVFDGPVAAMRIRFDGIAGATHCRAVANSLPYVPDVKALQNGDFARLHGHAFRWGNMTPEPIASNATWIWRFTTPYDFTLRLLSVDFPAGGKMQAKVLVGGMPSGVWASTGAIRSRSYPTIVPSFAHGCTVESGGGLTGATTVNLIQQETSTGGSKSFTSSGDIGALTGTPMTYYVEVTNYGNSTSDCLCKMEFDLHPYMLPTS